MADNDIIILNRILEEKKSHEMDSSRFFEMFSFEQILKNFDLSQEEIDFGNTSGGDDGGIDGFFTFLNGELLMEISGTSEVKRQPKMDIYIIQSKQSSSFSENALDKIQTTLNNLFDLTKSIEALKNLYNSSLIEKARIFREIFLNLSSKHPLIQVHFLYITKGDVKEIHKKLNIKSNEIKTLITKLISNSEVEIKFIGARQLLDLSRKERSYSLPLNFSEYLSRGQDNYVFLASLNDYYQFVTDEEGNLRKYIFESNVRDYQGDVQVNKEIQETLSSEKTLDFWWLNNGITVLASKANIAGKMINLEDVQIVNGLQTTKCLYNYLKNGEENIQDTKNRFILIKVILIQEEIARDKIIKATNFQTKIPDASFRATDRIQRNIEDFFKREGLYYDRRKNFYKNIGKPSEKIISIPYLAQTLMTLVLKEPHLARGRPSSLIKNDTDYNKIFDPTRDLSSYLRSVQIMKKVEEILRKREDDHPLPEKTNFRFHISLLVTMTLLQKKSYSSEDIIDINPEDIKEEIVGKIIDLIISNAIDFSEDKGGTLDSIAKSKEFNSYMISNYNLNNL